MQLKLTQTLFLLITFIASPVVFAQDNENESESESSSEQQRKPDDDPVNPLENADINIIKKDDRTIEVYKTNGRIYKVKIIPSKGLPYYLYDMDNNGSLETRSNRALDKSTVNQWKIFSW